MSPQLCNVPIVGCFNPNTQQKCSLQDTVQGTDVSRTIQFTANGRPLSPLFVADTPAGTMLAGVIIAVPDEHTDVSRRAQ